MDLHVDIAVGAAAIHLAWQVGTVNLQNGVDCMRKFVSNKWFGAIIFVGIVLGNIARGSKNNSELQDERVPVKNLPDKEK